ncbi:MAG: DegT/DnrJ/EryC1/StrS aminotransferase [Elusimicrobia bacterium]|nr:MAG: DegT/DnrJ/EryC1/StrS aminotransferase [Elusimicrobiota bacterium]KAF0157335.1 MAG: DegT/DnrJ/EryC1/StrS aminotransferase [Elusimicrobiota bacterium]
MKVPMVDMLAGYPPIKDEIENAVKTVFNKANFILGEEVAKFEKEFAAHNGTKYAVGVANGTDAIRMALIASGVKKGDEVITSPFTFIATSETISQAGAVPVFADIDPVTFNLDPKSVEKKITPKTRAIMPVHLYGLPCDMDALMAIAKKHNLLVIEDTAQAFTAKYKPAGGDWKYCGSMGHCGTYSFFPAKNLGAFGDGGAVTTSDDKIYETLKQLRNHGSKVRYHHEMEGFNSRLDTVQAAILSIRLKHVEKWTEMRNQVAARYAKALESVCVTPAVPANCRHSFNYYTLRFDSKAKRDNAQKHLTEQGIANQIYYPIALHLQDAYAHLGGKRGDLPVCDAVMDTVFSLPMYPELSDEQIKTVTDAVRGSVQETVKK